MSGDPGPTLGSPAPPRVRTRGLPDGADGGPAAQDRRHDPDTRPDPATDDHDDPRRPRPRATGIAAAPAPLRGAPAQHTDRKVAGVAGGLGRHLNVDPTVLRVLLVVLCFFGGRGLPALRRRLAPGARGGPQPGRLASRPGTRNALLIGTAALAGLIVVGNGLGGWSGPPWQLVVVGLAVVLYLGLRDSRPPLASQPPHPDTPSPTNQRTAAHDQFRHEYRPPGTEPYAQDPPWLPPASPPPARPYPPRGPHAAPVCSAPTLALLAIALGGLGLFDALGGDVRARPTPLSPLAVVGAMLVLGAFMGRPGGLVLLGVLAIGALTVTSAVDAAGGLGTDGRRISIAPTSAGEVRDTYSIDSGGVPGPQRGQRPRPARGPHHRRGRWCRRAGRGAAPGVRSDVNADIGGPGAIELPDGGYGGGFGTDAHGVFGSGSDIVTITPTCPPATST